MLGHELERELTGRIIPFWRSLRDDVHGGFFGEVDFDLRIDRDADKSSLMMCRILWFFATAARQLRDPVLLADARQAYDFLVDHCFDQDNGGLFWSVSRAGVPHDTLKHTYAQAFGIYALSAYFRASGDTRALGLALNLRDLIEGSCRDGRAYREAHDASFRQVPNDKLSENGVLAERTMNTLLHMLEGYAGLYEAAPDPVTASAIRDLLNTFLTAIYNPERHRLEVFFDADLNSLIDLHSFGHDIEASWLVEWAAGLLRDPGLDSAIGEMCTDLAQEVYRSGYRGGAVLNEALGDAVDTSRVWWVQVEALQGFARAGERAIGSSWAPVFAQAVDDVWHFIRSNLIDPRPGSEWYWRVDERGRPFRGDPMAATWKCPYHNGRACLRLIEHTGALFAAPVGA
ncbi:MAG: AGE family epimerase/isomerase [Bifidobacteriaceae bacterium]|jgi:mannobiose 2-epimerase|nr:AGE family epimerase/isomerase [Bifidobacteriaceae bacterium]